MALRYWPAVIKCHDDDRRIQLPEVQITFEARRGVLILISALSAQQLYKPAACARSDELHSHIDHHPRIVHSNTFKSSELTETYQYSFNSSPNHDDEITTTIMSYTVRRNASSWKQLPGNTSLMGH